LAAVWRPLKLPAPQEKITLFDPFRKFSTSAGSETQIKRCGAVTKTTARPPKQEEAAMNEAYFTRRLLEALTQAEQATNAEERSTHVRATRYYRDLLQWPEQRRSVRHPVRIGAVLHHLASSPRPLIVSDLSSQGFRVELDEMVKPGTIVALQMDGLVPFEAYIVWQRGIQVGCKFLAELHPALLEAAIAVSPPVQ
jgi:hypothetical protein